MHLQWLVSLALLLVQQVQAQTPIKIGLEWFLNPDHLPLVVALKEGYFADAGLDVTLVEPADHWEAEEEIIAGRLDVAVTETLHLAQDAARGKPVIGFSRFLHTDGGVMFLKGKGIERPSDMCGKTISYPGYPGPGGPAIVGTMVKADGGECSEAFGKHDGGFYHVDALTSGADVATLIFSNFEMVEARSRGLDAGFFSLKDWGVPDFCQLVLFTTPEKLEASSADLRKLVLAVRRATRFRLLHVANVLAPAALCTYGPFLIIYVFAYSTSRGLDMTEVYSRNRVGLIYHCGVLSCHTLTYYLALNVPSQQSYAAARGKRLR